MRPNNSAFTLIELLVVISIIGLLAALLLPTLAKTRGAAEVVSCQANQRSTMQALVSYTTQSKEYLPPGNGLWGKTTSGSSTLGTRSDAYRFYIAYYGAGVGIDQNGVYSDSDLQGLWACPTDTIVNIVDSGNGSRSGSARIRIDWNGMLGDFKGKTTVDDVVGRGLDPNSFSDTTRRISDVANPGVTVAMGDSLYQWLTIGGTHYVVFRHGSNFTVPSPWVASGPTASLTQYTALWNTNQLNGNANLAYVDGHVNSTSKVNYSASVSAKKLLFSF